MKPRLLRATSLIGRRVVTLGGDSWCEIKDLVFAPESGELVGFTLRKPGFLGGPLKETLAVRDIHGLGPDAVMISGPDALGSDSFAAGGGNVIGDRVLTETGTDLGEVVEVIVSTSTPIDVVGFEIEASDAIDDHDGRAFIPLPDTISMSAEHVVVPDAARDYVHDDLTGFGGAVEDFRRQLREAN